MQSVSGAPEFHTIIAELLSNPLCVSLQFPKVQYCVSLFFPVLCDLIIQMAFSYPWGFKYTFNLRNATLCNVTPSLIS